MTTTDATDAADAHDSPAATDQPAEPGDYRPPATDAGPGAADAAVPDGADPAVCNRCYRPFPGEHLLALHRGLAHYDDLSADEREAYESAYRDEAADLRVFRLQALVVLVVLYFGFLFAYSAFG